MARTNLFATDKIVVGKTNAEKRHGGRQCGFMTIINKEKKEENCLNPETNNLTPSEILRSKAATQNATKKLRLHHDSRSTKDG